MLDYSSFIQELKKDKPASLDELTSSSFLIKNDNFKESSTNIDRRVLNSKSNNLPDSKSKFISIGFNEDKMEPAKLPKIEKSKKRSTKRNKFDYPGLKLSPPGKKVFRNMKERLSQKKMVYDVTESLGYFNKRYSESPKTDIPHSCKIFLIKDDPNHLEMSNFSLNYSPLLKVRNRNTIAQTLTRIKKTNPFPTLRDMMRRSSQISTEPNVIINNLAINEDKNIGGSSKYLVKTHEQNTILAQSPSQLSIKKKSINK